MMKRWITATCVGLLCGAAYAQCDKAAKAECSEAATAVTLVKAESECASASTKPTSNWLSVAFHRAKAVKADDCSKSCPESAKVVTASQTKDASCCPMQNAAAAIVAAAAKTDDCSAKSSCSETKKER
eukprot:TRINITY_DN57578_c3_g1_i1.p3 TRINITY_DN57578_c3_g1~~TRINITY_DN57578_c3_g1_i1.p3  ORF type:complete len:128 (+),score=16.52 TRINITY_DN57578_c3_g1_i1:59-442(+)